MDVDPCKLPHWSRVAFAAHCARRVQPLFLEAWPNATTVRQEAVERAIALAEKAANERRSVEGLDQAVLTVVAVAGRALIPHYCPPFDEEDSEPSPPDRNAAVIASLAAKVAENAAQAARVKPSNSKKPAHEAFHFALDAIRASGRLGLIEALEADFEVCLKTAANKPWWRFW